MIQMRIYLVVALNELRCGVLLPSLASKLKSLPKMTKTNVVAPSGTGGADVVRVCFTCIGFNLARLDVLCKHSF